MPAAGLRLPGVRAGVQILRHLVDEMVKQGRLSADNQALIVIEDWQQDLKKITMRIVWTDPGEKAKSYERKIFLHRNRGSE